MVDRLNALEIKYQKLIKEMPSDIQEGRNREIVENIDSLCAEVSKILEELHREEVLGHAEPQ